MPPVPRRAEPLDPAIAKRLAALARKIERSRADLTELEDARKALVLEARATGASAYAIADAAGISHVRVYQFEQADQ